ncbi:NAD(P)-binding protein [Acidianus sulfidivorans JP7]|uniref:FAD-dependent oxidoreductase n=1 Tax=Acidianus sulfidivorans JP7 TaxID=619593 RepID=A0A2U9IKW4_9CREN|nr:NAD(P)/FAD-dependent oxidoreductase [Acidianus sulfidivorans]AWR96688.1 NAD(P)-binding protein [Acidianus sulfidivorans JP7]
MTKIAIVGGGPAGISLAYFLKGTKIDATVYESLDNVGLKPCAWGLMKGIENYIPIPKESIISEIKGFKIYLDGKLLYDVRKKEKLGYIIDKPKFLSILGEQVDLQLKSHIQEKKQDNSEIGKKNESIEGEKTIKINNSKEEKVDKIIYANGHYSLSKDYTIPAIQYITDYKIDPEIVEMYFFSDLLGYGWIFPEENGSKIGIGGYASVDFLKEKLKTILSGNIKKFEGARVTDYGIIEERLKSGNYVGEALGTVYAVTGEGIRPSIISSKIMADSLLEGKDFSKEFKKSNLYFSMQVHAKIIKSSKGKNSIKGLERVLLKADPDLVLKFAMGDFTKLDLLKLFGRMII